MLIKVKEGHSSRLIEVQNIYGEDDAKMVAFRFVHKRREEDYNELMHNTAVVRIEGISPQTQELLRDLK